MNGKDKCRILKEIRRQIAEQNDIEWVVSECRHQGNCKGTCPKCESEVRKLEQELSLRRKVGKTVALAGVSAACVAGLTGCTLDDAIETGRTIIEDVREFIHDRIAEPITELDGDVVYIPDDELSGYIAGPDEPDYGDYPEIEALDGEVAIENWD